MNVPGFGVGLVERLVALAKGLADRGRRGLAVEAAAVEEVVGRVVVVVRVVAGRVDESVGLGAAAAVRLAASRLVVAGLPVVVSAAFLVPAAVAAASRAALVVPAVLLTKEEVVDVVDVVDAVDLVRATRGVDGLAVVVDVEAAGVAFLRGDSLVGRVGFTSAILTSPGGFLHTMFHFISKNRL